MLNEFGKKIVTRTSELSGNIYSKIIDYIPNHMKYWWKNETINYIGNQAKQKVAYKK